jgi:hypothetical protein
MSLAPARVTKEQADAFIAPPNAPRRHRHHDPDQGCRFVVGAWDVERNVLCGVGVCGRPRAGGLAEYGERIVEVTRCCTDGTFNACSFIYARAAEVARAQGFACIMTYTLAKEGGPSLRALGWWPETLTPNPNTTWANRKGRKADAVRADVRWCFIFSSEHYTPPVVEAVSPQLDWVSP